jgi:hypothetical protein
MLIQLLSPAGIRLMDIREELPTILVPIHRRLSPVWTNEPPRYEPIPVREFVRVSPTTYIERT